MIRTIDGEELLPIGSAAQVGLPLICNGTTAGDVVFSVLSPTAINTSSAAAAPTSAHQLWGDGWRTASTATQTITLISTTQITSGAASVVITIPSGYAQHQLEMTKMVNSARGDLIIQKNVVTANYDSIISTWTDAGLSANVNCAAVSATIGATGRHNGSAINCGNTALLGVNPEGGGTVTLMIDGATGAVGQTIRGNSFGHPTRTATVPSAVHTLIFSNIYALCKSTAKMTAIKLFPDAGAFEGGTITLKGVAR